MISILMDYIGTIKKSILILILMITKFYKLIILNKAIGKNQDFLEETILGEPQQIKMHLLIDLSI